MSKTGDSKYFEQILATLGYDSIESKIIIDTLIKAMQDKLIEGDSLTLPNFGRFQSSVVPAHTDNRFGGKHFPETLKVTFTPSRRGFIEKWKKNYSTAAKTEDALEKLKKSLTK